MFLRVLPLNGHCTLSDKHTNKQTSDVIRDAGNTLQLRYVWQFITFTTLVPSAADKKYSGIPCFCAKLNDFFVISMLTEHKTTSIISTISINRHSQDYDNVDNMYINMPALVIFSFSSCHHRHIHIQSVTNDYIIVNYPVLKHGNEEGCNSRHKNT